MKQKISTSGNKGPGIRSDCFITIELTDNPGINIILNSKVNALYGNSIKELVKEIFDFFDIKNSKITIEDSGALPYIIAARIEAAIKQLFETKKEFLPEFISNNKYHTNRERNRISRLYLPGNTPRLMINAGVHKPDGIILDLEDSVAVNKKVEARLLVRNTLRQLDFYGAERMVRINQIPIGLEDLDYIIPHNVNLILIPKCENAKQINLVNEKISELNKEEKTKNPIWLMPIIESAKGVINAYEIASASDNVVAIAIGLEDYTADIGTKRTNEGTESFFARSQVVNAARAAGVQPIDSVFSDVGDMDALKENVKKSKALGFDGMGCIHPRQIRVIHDNFAPDEIEIDKAKKIVIAFDEATEKGLGVVSLGTKMIDPPVVKRAQNTIELAISTNKLSKDWKTK